MSVFRMLLVPVVTAAALLAQSAPSRPEFEVASVKPAAPLAPGAQMSVGVHIDGAQVSCRFLSLQDYINMAFNIKKHQITGPDWLATERYDIQAKIPAGFGDGTVREEMRLMMQSLLEDRFKLKFHRETRELPVYALVVMKSGAKLKETPVDPDSVGPPKAIDVAVSAGRGGTMVSLPGGASMMYGFLFVDAKKVNMITLVDQL